MAFTVSNRQAGVTRAKVAGLVRHEFRDVDKRDGRETAHSGLRKPTKKQQGLTPTQITEKTGIQGTTTI